MAKAEHLSLIRQGAEIWNQWFRDNPKTHPDLSLANLKPLQARLNGANLSRADLSGADLSEANLHKADLFWADLSTADLSRANLSAASLSMADLSGAQLNGADLSGADLSQAKLSRAKLNQTKLSGANLIASNLSAANLSRADLCVANLREANLCRANLSEANLSSTDLSGASLRGANLSLTDLSNANLNSADLSDAELYRADLNGADCSGAVFSGANLSGADLCGANLSGADLRGANLSGVNLSGADLGYARIGWTALGNVNLGQAEGLETVHHEGPSTIGIDTLYTSAGSIPEEFLRGAGLPDQFNTYSKSLVGKPIESNSLFISFSSEDEEFANQLFASLQENNVRAWFAPEGLKIEEKFQQMIDRSIRRHHKLLLILSEDSITSDWIAQEVETALAKEKQHNQVLLFPLRVDNTVLETEPGWLAQLKNTHHISGFSQWQDQDAFQQEFQRILRGLRAAQGELDPAS